MSLLIGAVMGIRAVATAIAMVAWQLCVIVVLCTYGGGGLV